MVNNAASKKLRIHVVRILFLATVTQRHKGLVHPSMENLRFKYLGGRNGYNSTQFLDKVESNVKKLINCLLL